VCCAAGSVAEVLESHETVGEARGRGGSSRQPKVRPPPPLETLPPGRFQPPGRRRGHNLPLPSAPLSAPRSKSSSSASFPPCGGPPRAHSPPCGSPRRPIRPLLRQRTCCRAAATAASACRARRRSASYQALRTSTASTTTWPRELGAALFLRGCFCHDLPQQRTWRSRRDVPAPVSSRKVLSARYSPKMRCG
jgi:hypothetical protein